MLSHPEAESQFASRKLSVVFYQYADMSGTEAQPEQRLSALPHTASTATSGEHSDSTFHSRQHLHFRTLSGCPGFIHDTVINCTVQCQCRAHEGLIHVIDAGSGSTFASSAVAILCFTFRLRLGNCLPRLTDFHLQSGCLADVFLARIHACQAYMCPQPQRSHKIVCQHHNDL